MFIAIEHEIHDPKKFQECAERVFPLPKGLHVHQFLPATDLSRAACLYEVDSLEEVRAYVDGAALLPGRRSERNRPAGETGGVMRRRRRAPRFACGVRRVP